MGLRPYQNEALAAINEDYRAGRRRLLVSMATGTGKTVVFSALPEAFGQPGKWLILVHRKELATQAADKMSKWNPHLKVGIDMGEKHCDPSCDVIVASVQTLGMEGGTRIEQYDPAQYAGLVVDEAHHAVGDGYGRVFDRFGMLRPGCDRLLLGVTATPNRGDGAALAEVFEKITYNLSMFDAVTQGWLSDIRGIKISTDVLLDEVKTRAGDFDQRQLEKTVNTPARNKLIVQKWLEHAKDFPTIGFTVDIQHAKDLAQAYKDAGVKAEAVWGVDPDREEKLAAHVAGDLTVLLNSQVLTEGYDDWRIRCVLMAKPTKSTLAYTQMIGRGTRLQEGVNNLLEAKAQGVQLIKQDCLVMDVVDNTSKHSLVTAPSLFGMNSNLNLRGRSMVATKALLDQKQKQYPMVDVGKIDDIATLDSRVEDVDLWKVKFAEEVEKESNLQWHKTPDGQYVLRLSDNDGVRIRQDLLQTWYVELQIGTNEMKENFSTRKEAFRFSERMVKLCDTKAYVFSQRNAAWHDVPATKPQLGMLRGLGIRFSPTITKGEASKLITRYKTQTFDNVFAPKGQDTNAETRS